MSNLFLTSFIIFSFICIVSTFLKRDYKKRIHRAYRAFCGETKDGFLGEYVNLFFPIPYKSSNPDFYKNHDIQKLVRKVSGFRLIQLVSLGLLIISLVIQVNYGFQ
jgi:hypothetical protein